MLRKETLQTVRDRRLMFMLIFAPVMQLLVFGYAVDFKVDRLPTVIADQDQSAESREHLRRLLADGTLAAHPRRRRAPAQAQRALEAGDATAAIVVPKGFSRSLASGETAEVQVLIDGSGSQPLDGRRPRRWVATSPRRAPPHGARGSRRSGEPRPKVASSFGRGSGSTLRSTRRPT